MLALAVPKSMPVTVKSTGCVELKSDRLPWPAGSASRTYGGTVNCKSACGAMQVKLTVRVPEVADPLMVTYVFRAPPVQCTVTPCERMTVVMVAMSVHLNGGVG